MTALDVGKMLFALLFLWGGTSTVAVSETLDECEPSIRDGWRVVSTACAIGDGMWGKKPDSETGRFWVQCGLLNRWPDDAFAAVMQRGAPHEGVVLREEGKHFRCLVGPYQTFSQAVSSRDRLRELPPLKSAFVRSVNRGTDRPGDTKVSEPVKTKVNAKTHRRYVEYAGVKSPQPKENEARYRIDDQTWWRATYNEAFSSCQRDGLSLISERTIKRIASIPSLSNELPNRLPYWVAGRRAYDTAMGVAMPLSEDSALLVLCE